MKLIIQLGSRPLQDSNCLNNSFMMVSTGTFMQAMIERIQIVSTILLWWLAPGPSCRPWLKVLFIRGLVILFFSVKASHQHLKHLWPKEVWALICGLPHDQRCNVFAYAFPIRVLCGFPENLNVSFWLTLITLRLWHFYVYKRFS